MQPEVVSRELVKPSSSAHPKDHVLSFFDNDLPCFYVPLVFFYTTENGATDQLHRSSALKDSLRAALSHYYPLAGRVAKDYATLDCNDEGVVFLEATMECNLSEILKNPDDKIVELLLPESLHQRDSSLTGPVAIQVTYFQGGGMSIGICLCHKVIDMESMVSFINEWASLARNSNHEISLEFNIGSLYPPIGPPLLNQKLQFPLKMKDRVTRRLVFDGSSVAKLKAMVSHQVPNPTRVEVVSALLYKSAISAAAKASSPGGLKSSVMTHAMNLRTHVSPPLTKRNKGNMTWNFAVSVRKDRDVELGRLVMEFRQSKAQLSNCCAKASRQELLESLKSTSEYFNGENEVYICSSWCNFPFYEADFGWGKPLWVTTVSSKRINVIILINTTEGDGIEAYIRLEENVIAVLEQDQELLSFSRLNPSIDPVLE